VHGINPSGYPESQGAFAERVRREVGARLNRTCRLGFGSQNEFPEPPVRINTDHVNPERLQWSDKAGWDPARRVLRGKFPSTLRCAT
jgi:hypothetical protein